ncbi:MAG: hypothetical protein J6B43_12145 [Lachnospiraceae bacterium]|nr:hypothetical protein [Lachnospiraceae bacterium]
MENKMNWDEVDRAQSEEELRNMKLWLFQENIRLQNERSELESMRDKFIQEKVRFRDEMDALNRRMVLEQKRLREENLFFDKKLAILQDGFRKLEEDRQRLEAERRRIEQSSRNQRERAELPGQGEDIANVLFRSAGNPLALRKRYRDLLKIFHPDNFCGDAELMQYINREFQKRKEE